MSTQYKFRVLIDQEGDEEAFRDIEIRNDQTFDVFHKVILRAFGFSGMQMASFYVSDEEWNKGQEIGLMNMSEYGEDFLTMTDTPIGEVIDEVGQKLLYVYDFLNMWCFYIDLVQISDLEEGKEYPFIALALGIAPDENSKDPMREIQDMMDDNEGYDFDEEEYGLDDDFENFDNIDDYDF